jgi:hypothetical protein
MKVTTRFKIVFDAALLVLLAGGGPGGRPGGEGQGGGRERPAFVFNPFILFAGVSSYTAFILLCSLPVFFAGKRRRPA